MKKTNCTINGISYYRKYANINGIRKMVYGESQKDWQDKVNRLNYQSLLGVIENNSTLEKAMGLWVYDVLAQNPSIRQSTFAIRECVFRNRIKNSQLAKRKLSEIKSLDVQHYYNELLSQGKSGHALHQAKTLLNMFFKYAVSEGYMAKNPCGNAHIPSPPEPKEITVYSDSDIEKLKLALIGERNRFLFILAFSTGMRIGELLALKHSDMKKDYVSVTKTQLLKRYPDKNGKFTYVMSDEPPKTKASYRNIPLPKNIQKEYQIHKKMCQEEKLKWGKGRLAESDPLFLSMRGLRCQTAQIQRSWGKIQEKAGVNYKSLHSIRHTYITKLIQSGVNVVTVMQLAGHSKMQTTLRYTHVEMEQKQKAIDVINDLIEI